MEIVNFENSGLITNLEVAEYLYSDFPLHHVEKIAKIEYIDIYMKYDGPQPRSDTISPFIKNTLGECELDENTSSYLIRIYRQSPEGSHDLEKIKITIAHEVAHVVYAELPFESHQLWLQLDKKNIARIKARLTTENNFVEHYVAYIKNSKYVKEAFSDEYIFMRDRVFCGREY